MAKTILVSLDDTLNEKLRNMAFYLRGSKKKAIEDILAYSLRDEKLAIGQELINWKASQQTEGQQYGN